MEVFVFILRTKQFVKQIFFLGCCRFWCSLTAPRHRGLKHLTPDWLTDLNLHLDDCCVLASALQKSKCAEYIVAKLAMMQSIRAPCPCFCLAAVWPENLEVLYQHPHHRSVTPISVNTLTAEADSHSCTPPVPFSSVSQHTPTSPRAYNNFEETGGDGGGGGGGGGRQRTIMDQHLFSLQGTAEPWAKLIAGPVSLGGLNNI